MKETRLQVVRSADDGLSFIRDIVHLVQCCRWFVLGDCWPFVSISVIVPVQRVFFIERVVGWLVKEGDFKCGRNTINISLIYNIKCKCVL